MHPLVLERLQEFPEPFQIVHLGCLGQATRSGCANFFQDDLQMLHRVFDELAHRQNAHLGLGIGALERMKVF